MYISLRPINKDAPFLQDLPARAMPDFSNERERAANQSSACVAGIQCGDLDGKTHRRRSDLRPNSLISHRFAGYRQVADRRGVSTFRALRGGLQDTPPEFAARYAASATGP